MTRAVFRRTLTWKTGEGAFSFGESEGCWRLALPDGQLVELAPSDWKTVASAVVAFERSAGSSHPPEPHPANAGRPWTANMEDRLLREWQRNPDSRHLARLFERTRGAITSRLLRLGLLSERE